MICLFNGCSHTEGTHPISPQKTWSNIVLKSLSIDSKFIHIHSCDGWDNEHIFGHLNNTKQTLNFTHDIGISVAKSGKGNDSICFETINYVEYLKQINKKPDYIFIQWSGPTRRIVQTWDDKVQYLNPHNISEIGFQPNWEPLGSSLTLTYYVILQNYLEKNNIEYVFIDYPGINDIVYNPYLKKSINYNKVFSISGNINLLEYLIEHNLNIDKDGHPNELGHYFIAESVMGILKKNTIKYSDLLKIFNEDYLESQYNEYYRITHPSSLEIKQKLL